VLLKFKVENFRSYAEPGELSLLRGTKQRAEVNDGRVVRLTPNGPDVLRAAAIFGPNAGGKSNLLKAIVSLKRAVLRSAADDEVLLPFQPFASPEFRAKPVHFEIECVAGERQFSYSTSFFEGKVLEESLSTKPLGSKALPMPMFHRTTPVKNDAANIEFAGELKGHPDAEQWRRNTRPHQLFLSQSQNLSAAPFLQHLEDWFSSTLVSVNTSSIAGFGIHRIFPSWLSKRLGEDAFRNRVINELVAADLGITDLKLTKQLMPYLDDSDGAPVKRNLEQSRIRFVHSPSDGEEFELDFNDESDGTKYFFSLLGPLDDVIQNNRILLIDELDRSLHPLLVLRIAKAFAQGTSKSQLIFTTHDATLLDTDVLRRDQVWFAERNARHHSSLRRLANGNVRLDKALMRAYLDGQFQGVPITDSQGVFSDA